MHTPVFTAEASLYRTRGLYGAADAYRDRLNAGNVEPASASARNCIKICEGDPDCLYCCRCLAAGGKASHCCF